MSVLGCTPSMVMPVSESEKCGERSSPLPLMTSVLVAMVENKVAPHSSEGRLK